MTLKAFAEAYPTESWTYDLDKLLSWPVNAKRDWSACTPTASISADSLSGSPTGPITSVLSRTGATGMTAISTGLYTTFFVKLYVVNPRTKKVQLLLSLSPHTPPQDSLREVAHF